ncbi:MAG: hypothetical protein NVSMB66_6620 [Candidatus Doudnabacteria bacterium]
MRRLVRSIFGIAMIITVLNYASSLSLSLYRPFNQKPTPAIETAQLTKKATDAVSKVNPGVVSIFGTKVYPINFEIYQETNAGTGFFVNSDGYILTNKHVVADTNFNYYVILENGKRQPASVVYRDPSNDLAVIKIKGKNYPVLNLGDSSKLKVGENVLGIGNAYGKVRDTVSAGTVSRLDQSVIAQGEETQTLHGVIQTTAQLYPGDSGGPLFDLEGNVVGIDVAIAAEKGNVSFSIPINDAKPIIDSTYSN